MSDSITILNRFSLKSTTNTENIDSYSKIIQIGSSTTSITIPISIKKENLRVSNLESNCGKISITTSTE